MCVCMSECLSVYVLCDISVCMPCCLSCVQGANFCVYVCMCECIVGLSVCMSDTESVCMYACMYGMFACVCMYV